METSLDPGAVGVRLAPWLSALLGGDVDVRGVEVPAHGGMSHETLLVDAVVGGSPPRPERLVVRVAPEPPGVFPAYDLEREIGMLRALAGTAVPVPAVRGTEPAPTVLGRPFFVMDRVEGEVPSDDPPYRVAGFLHDAATDDQAVAQAGVVDAMAALHGIDVVATGVPGGGIAAGLDAGLDAQVRRTRRYLDWVAGAHGPLPVLEAAFDRCAARVPAPSGPDVAGWGDARLGNVVFGPDFGVRALLDWEMAAVGPPEVDLGWFLFVEDTAEMWLDPLPGFVGRDELLARYEAAAGRRVDDLAWYEVFAGVRAAAIQARLADRAAERGRLAPEAAARARHHNPVVLSLRRLLPDLPDPPR